MSRSIEQTGVLVRSNLPQLDERKIRLISDFEWWDGPLSGVLTYEGNPFWFDYINACAECYEHGCDHEGEGRHYFYAVKPITNDQLEEYNKNGGIETNNYLGPMLADVPAIGWFTDGHNQSFYAIVVHKQGCDGKVGCDCIITGNK